MYIGKKQFDTKQHTYIMGILNVTPDSFSDGGTYHRLDQALFHVEEMLRDGMDILDIGGESTRPGYTPVSEEEEIARITPVIEKVKERFEVPVSVDTYKSRVALSGIQAGADMINDIWGLMYEEDMAKVIADTGVACCLMHNRKENRYTDFFEDMMADMKKIVAKAKYAGIADDKIILDPGVGFAKSYENNLEAIRRAGELRVLGYPVLLGTSKKSVIGLTLELPVEERGNGTLATSAYGVMQGCSFLRVHDVRANKELVNMMEAILYRG